jgi:hypothetical protein
MGMHHLRRPLAFTSTLAIVLLSTSSWPLSLAAATAIPARIPGVTAEPIRVGVDPIRLTDEFILLYYAFVPDPRFHLLWLFGELENVGSRPALAPTLTVEFLDADGEELSFFADGSDDELTSVAYFSPLYRWVPSGGRVPIGRDVHIDVDDLDGWESEELGADPFPGDPDARDPAGLELTFFAETDAARPETGVLVNHGTEDRRPAVYTEFYDAAGRFSGACAARGDLATVAPGDAVEVEFRYGCDSFERGQAASIAGGPFTVKYTVALLASRSD